MTLKPAPRSFLLLAALAFTLVAVGPAAGQKRALAPRPQPRPWLVLVSHRIDLTRAASRMMTSSREVRLLTGPRFVINLTTGLLVDREGHVVTRLVNLDPTDTEHDIKVTTATGAVLEAAFVGLDQPTGLAVLSVPELRGVEPAQGEAADIARPGAAVRVVTAQVVLPLIKIPSVERVAVYPKLVASAGTIAEGASEALARSGVVAVVASPALSSSSDLSLLERTDGALAGLVLYVSPGRGHVLPIAYLRDGVAGRVVESNGSVRAGWLGAQGLTVDDVPMPDRPAWATEGGVLIQTISANGPADAAGLRRNDVVVRFDGVAVRTTSDLLACVGATPAGTRVSLDVVRDVGRVTLQPVLGGRPLAPGAPPVAQATDEQTLRFQILGLRQQLANERDPAKRDVISKEIRNLTERLRAAGGPSLEDATTIGISGHSLTVQEAARYGVDGGVEIHEVAPSSAAAAGGLVASDVVVKAGGTPVDGFEKLDAAVRRAQAGGAGRLVLEILRRGRPTTVTIVLPPPPATPK
jgi:S1-C subfamily serine protease